MLNYTIALIYDHLPPIDDKFFLSERHIVPKNTLTLQIFFMIHDSRGESITSLPHVEMIYGW